MPVKCHGKFLVGAVLSLIFVFMLGNNTFAATETNFHASDGVVYDHFGESVSISGDAALVGAYAADDNGSSSGSAYIFVWDGSGWVNEQKILPGDGYSGDRFGDSVAISGEVALVGAPNDDDNGSSSGSAYIFGWDSDTESWVEKQKLLPEDGAGSDYFGKSVAISGDVALIGAYGDDDDGSSSGSAYIFRWDADGESWVQEQKLLPLDGEGAASDYFGKAVSISGDVALIGAYGDDDNGGASGSAYIFRWDGDTESWVEEQKLLPEDGAATDYFGQSVSISGDVALVGAVFGDDNGENSGSAYVFRWDGSTWVEEEKLLASDGAADDRFGQSVSISEDVALVGAIFDDDNGEDAGSAYMFRWDGTSWGEGEKLLPIGVAAGDYFGQSVSICDDIALALVGADNGAGLVSGTGSAYAYDYFVSSEIEVSIDIKPDSEINCFNIKSHGVIPVVILGSADLDVMDINVDTLLLNGSPVQVRGKNEKTMYHLEDVTGDYTHPKGEPDGYLDLVCQFEIDPDQWVVEQTEAGGEPTEAILTGELNDGTAIFGSDTICIKADSRKKNTPKDKMRGDEKAQKRKSESNMKSPAEQSGGVRFKLK